MKLKFVTLLSTILSSSHSLQIDSQTCDCDTIKFSSQNPYILRKYEQALGLYNRVKGVEVADYERVGGLLGKAGYGSPECGAQESDRGLGWRGNAPYCALRVKRGF